MSEVVTTNSSGYINNISKEYSLYVCENRAIPKISDGLKDSQRKMLWVIRNISEKIKTVSLGGASISQNLYTHGDSSASGTISMLAGPYCNNIPLLQGIGQFGTRVATTSFAAPRYTYVKKYKMTENLVYPDLDIAPLKENYDGSTVEPISFLPIIPLVLLNGVSGIAVGWSTEILPRKLSDIVKATISALDGKKINTIKPNYTYLDCSIKNIDENQWLISGKCKIVDSSTIHITELPPDVSLEKFKERLNKLEDDNKINSYVDRSTGVIDVIVKFPRGSVKDWTEEYAVNFLKLTQKKTERIVVVGWNNRSIVQYDNAETLVREFVEWRLKWYYKRYENKKNLDEIELNYWKAVKVCFDEDLPKALPDINNKEDLEFVIGELCSDIEVTKDQVSKISSLPSYRWTSSEHSKVLEKIKILEGNITEYEDIMSDESKIRKIYKDELEALI